jgi:cytochrome c peroxidase
LATLAACNKDLATSSPLTAAGDQARFDVTTVPSHPSADSLRTLAASHGIVSLPVTPAVRTELVKLGQALVFDPILSGNRNMACMTCHLPAFGTGDRRNLSIGEGGIGFGPTRTLGRGQVIPRNAPALFNLASVTQLFWDGRVSTDSAGVFHTPANTQLTPDMARVFEFGAISAIGMFPVTVRAEMRGQFGPATTAASSAASLPIPPIKGGPVSSPTVPGSNELAGISDDNFTGIWSALMARLGKIPEYRKMFEAAYPGTSFDQMTFANASNAMAGFMVSQLNFTNAPWDRFLGGNDAALSTDEVRGGITFMNSRCAGCHSGALFSDGKSRNVALAQFGPGEGNGPSGHDDFGRMNVTGVATDKYLFRTSPLRNVELTAPYGHAGQFADLHSFVDHYSDVDTKLRNYNINQIDPSLRGTLQPTTEEILSTRAAGLVGLVLTPQQVDDITRYLKTLTDPAARSLNRITPLRVPSGLPVPLTSDLTALVP